MTNDILDYFGKDPQNKRVILEETNTYRFFLSIGWVIYALLLVYESLSILKGHQSVHENEGLFALISFSMPSVSLAFHYISLNFLSLVIAWIILKNKSSRKEFIIIVVGIIILYHLFEMFFLLSYYFFLRKEGLFFYLLLFASFKRNKEQLFPLNLSKIRIKFIPLLMIALFPFFIGEIIDYREIYIWDIDFRWLRIWFF